MQVVTQPESTLDYVDNAASPAGFLNEYIVSKRVGYSDENYDVCWLR
jgi:hypothetical protein